MRPLLADTACRRRSSEPMKSVSWCTAGEPGRPPSVAYFHSSLPSDALPAYKLLSYAPMYTTPLWTSGLPRRSSSHLQPPLGATSPLAFTAAPGAPLIVLGGEAEANCCVRMPVLARRRDTSASFMALAPGKRSDGL